MSEFYKAEKRQIEIIWKSVQVTDADKMLPLGRLHHHHPRVLARDAIVSAQLRALRRQDI